MPAKRHPEGRRRERCRSSRTGSIGGPTRTCATWSHERLVGELTARLRKRRRWAGPRQARPTSGPRQAPAARADRSSSRCRRPVPRIVAARSFRPVRRRGSGSRPDHRHRPCAGPRVHDRRQRCDSEGRHLFPDDGQEAPARPGDRAGKRACPASIWSIRAAPICPTRTRSFPIGEHFGRIFFNQASMSAAGIPQIAVVMGSRRPAAPMCPQWPTRRSWCAIRRRSFSAGRRW